MTDIANGTNGDAAFSDYALALLIAAVPVNAITIKKQAERRHAPDFKLKDASGRTVRLSGYRGRRQASHGEGAGQLPGADGNAAGGDRDHTATAIHAGTASRRSVEKAIQAILSGTK